MTERKHEDTSQDEGQRPNERQRKRQGQAPYTEARPSTLLHQAIFLCVRAWLFAGFIWGEILHWLFYLLHFTIVPVGFLAEPFSNMNIYIP